MKKNWQERVKDVETLAGSYQKHPINPAYKPKLSKPWQPSSIWKLFYRQHQAFNFSKSCKADVHVFALENENRKDTQLGQRIYLVTTYTELWFYYRNYRKSLMHCYEVIPEGAVCHLYFDLEFIKQTNPKHDGKQMVAKLIQYVCQKLGELYNIPCSVKDVLNLDSSTHEKFSRHLVFHLPNVAFRNNIHVGNFIRTIMQPVIEVLEKRRGGIDQETPRTGDGALLSASTAFVPVTPDKRKHLNAEVSENLSSKRIKSTLWEKSEERTLDPDLSFLIVKDKCGTDQLFVDLGVYTRNRNFRLYGSSKLGKNTSFQVAEDNQFTPKPQDNVSKEELIFLSSLVSNVRFVDGLTILTCDSPDTKKSKEQRIQDNSYHSVSETMGGYYCSPYPEIDNFIIGQTNKGGVQGVLRRWNYFSSEELIVYDISKNHWCENIGRAHKSNNIMIVVDLKREIWYQKCYDPVCRAQRFRSESHPLPHECCLDFLIDMDNEFVFTMDEDGNIKASQNKTRATQNHIFVENVDTGFDNVDDAMLLEAAEDTEFIVELHSELSGEELSDNDLLAAVEELEASVSVDTK
ncbi:DNA-directed primase/polymerase protein isoform X1 [Pristis pectinata]|uniref:DNA-directed primase/polymerase protein isoform X1 n=2 Tax=Pristis pectinata TaxID=685728 RepID=UPI00223DAC62|nr:DNA-directed primase/polymerase protein isoform X1 [Pristis pectinata]